MHTIVDMDGKRAGERLKQMIRAQWPPLSQAAFARRMQMHPTLLGHYLSGRREPPANFWQAAADLLDCDVTEITSSHEVAA